jgi:hypothetical protein
MLHKRSVLSGIASVVARVHDAIAEAARDYETLNQLRRALRRLEPGQENVW